MVSEEVTRTEDDLAKWLKESRIPIHAIDSLVADCLKKIYETDPSHRYIVANSGQHSLADPWVIAHAMNENAVVVTKEIKDTFNNPTKIKIPRIGDNMGVRWINDFEMVGELGIQFSCYIKTE